MPSPRCSSDLPSPLSLRGPGKEWKNCAEQSAAKDSVPRLKACLPVQGGHSGSKRIPRVLQDLPRASCVTWLQHTNRKKDMYFLLSISLVLELASVVWWVTKVIFWLVHAPPCLQMCQFACADPLVPPPPPPLGRARILLALQVQTRWLLTRLLHSSCSLRTVFACFTKVAGMNCLRGYRVQIKVPRLKAAGVNCLSGFRVTSPGVILG